MIQKNTDIKLYEYGESKTGELNSSDIFELQKINKAIGVNLFEIKANNIIKAKQYVGILRVNNKNIQVLPKIFGDSDDEKCNINILKNLLHMLSYTKKLQIKESDIAKMGETDSLFEIYIYLFATVLLSLLRKDFKKNYNYIQENSSFLKGRLLFAQHITRNLFNKSKFFIEYEKMDENILLNIFLHTVCRKLLKETKSEINYNLLSKCSFILKDIDTSTFRNSKVLNRLNFNKQNKEYKKVFTLGKMLYFGSSPDFNNLKNDNYSFMFDMNVLFEEFIAEFTKNNQRLISDNISKVYSQVQNKYVFKESRKFVLKPDILLEYEAGDKLIIDTKYKKLSKDIPYYGVSSSDIYQMFVYGMRYFGEYNTSQQKNIILLYPKYDQDFKTEYISEENIIIKIRTIDLNVDLSNDEGKNHIIKQLKLITKNIEIENINN